MTTYATNNPVGSTSVFDLYDNAENLDELVNNREKETHPDRLGVDRLTWHGIEQRFLEFLANSGYAPANGGLNDYDADSPFTINSFNEYVIKDGVPYRLSPENATVPYQTNGNWAEQSGDFVAVGDEVLRQELTGDMIDGNGALLVTGATIYRDTIQDLNALPAASLVDGKSAIVQGAEYRWDAAAQEWVNVSGWISPKAWGIQGIGDETIALQEFCEYASANDLWVEWDGDYEFSELSFSGNHKWRGSGTLYSNKTVRTGSGYLSDYAIQFYNEPVRTGIQLVSDLQLGGLTLQVDDATGIESGDMLHVRSTRLIDTDDRGGWTEGQIFKVNSVSGNTVFVENPSAYYGKANDVVTGTVTARVDDQTLTLDPMIPGFARDIRRELTITSGTASGESRYIVNYNGNNVTQTRDPWPAGVVAGVTFRAAWETTVDHFKSASVRIWGNNLELRRNVQLDAIAPEFGFRGLRIRGYSNSFTVMDVRGFSETGVHFWQCYSPFYWDSIVSDCNRSYTEFDGTGYGVSCEIVSYPSLKNIKGFRNRRTTDFSGSGGYTVYGLAENVEGHGGGRTYAGESFFPHGLARNSVTGSHGSGRFCRYVNCAGYNTYGGVNIRGRAEKVSDYAHYGYGHHAISFNFGSGHLVDGVFYTDQFTETSRVADGRQVISSQPGARLKYVLEYGANTGGIVSNINSTVMNVHCKATVEAGVWCNAGSAGVVRNLVFKDWFVECDPEGSSQTDFRFFRGPNPFTIDHIRFSNIQLNEAGSYSPGSSLLMALVGTSGDDTISHEVADKGWITIDGTYYVRIPAASTVRIPAALSTNNILFDLWNTRTAGGGSGRPRAIGCLIESLTAGDFSPHTSRANVDIVAAYPGTDDTTGVSSGNMGVNYNQGQGFVTLINNMSNAQTVALNIR